MPSIILLLQTLKKILMQNLVLALRKSERKRCLNEKTKEKGEKGKEVSFKEKCKGSKKARKKGHKSHETKSQEALEVTYTAFVCKSKYRLGRNSCVLFTGVHSWENLKTALEDGVSETRGTRFTVDDYVLKYEHITGNVRVEVLLTSASFKAFQHYLSGSNVDSISILAISKSPAVVPVFDLEKVATLKELDRKSTADQKNLLRTS